MCRAVVCAGKTKDAVILIEGFGIGFENVAYRTDFGADIAIGTRIFNVKMFVISHKFRTPNIGNFRNPMIKNIAFEFKICFCFYIA